MSLLFEGYFEVLDNLEHMPSPIKADVPHAPNSHQVPSLFSDIFDLEIDDTIRCNFQVLVEPVTVEASYDAAYVNSGGAVLAVDILDTIFHLLASLARSLFIWRRRDIY